MKKQYIGKKQVSSVEETLEKTPGGIEIVKVSYYDGTKEHLSKLMFDKTISNEICDETALRDKRVFPVVEMLAVVLREWGIKIGELQYISILLNNSLQNNSDQALIELVSEWMETPASLNDIDYLTIDRILKAKGKVSKKHESK